MRAANHPYVRIALAGITLLSCAKKENTEDALDPITTIVANSSELPTCSTETTAQVYWVEEQAKLYVCNGSSFVEIKGEKGDKGETGATGTQGSPANSGVWVFDKDAKPVGVLMDASLGLILFTNGAFARIDLRTGTYQMPAYISNSGGLDISSFLYVCASTEATCGGLCYTDRATPKGMIMRAGSSTYLVANGDEQLVNGATVRGGSNIDGTCTDLGGDVPLNGYPITKPYTFPEGITLPLKTPLSFGLKTEE